MIRVREDKPASFAEALVELEERLQAGEKFFRRGRATLELGNRVLEAADLEGVQAALARYEIKLEAIVSGANATRALAKQAGLTYKLPNNQNTRPPIPKLFDSVAPAKPENGSKAGMPYDTAEALFIRRTLRSGQVVQHHADIVVLGDVNPGAEIEAGGSVIVWGTVRGKIKAGAVISNQGAVICALSLRPTQLCIGEVVAVGNPEVSEGPDLGPEVASVQDGTIVVESWMPRRGRLR